MTIIVFLFVFIILVLVLFLPRLIIQLNARKHGLNIDLKEAFVIQTQHCGKKDFYQGAKLILDFEKIAISELVAHHISRGSLVNIGKGMEELKKRNKSVEFSMLCTIDLIEKNIKSEIIESEIPKSIEINNIRNKNLILDYRASYTYDFPYSVFIDESDNLMVDKVKVKLENFLKDWKETNVVATESFIRNNILPTDFFGTELSGIIVMQEFNIRENGRDGKS